MKHYFLISLLLVIVCIPKLTEAASVSFVVDNSVVYVGDTVVVNVFLDTKGETINAIDGNLSFSERMDQFHLLVEFLTESKALRCCFLKLLLN